MELSLIQKFCIWALPLLFAITVHEAAHGFVARAYGDPTATRLGRVTLNPLKHIDYMGSLIVPFCLMAIGGFLFGWAKPVPVQARYFKRPAHDMAMVALAGPGANAAMAIAWAAVAKGGVLLEATPFGVPMALMGLAGIQINLSLFLVNLLPIPPLDGSQILSACLPLRWAYLYNRITPYGFFILLALVASGLLSVIVNPMFQVLYYQIANLFNF